MSLQPDPSYWWTDAGGGLVTEWFRDVDPDTGQDRWVPLVAFLQPTTDGPWQVFPKQTLEDTVDDPALVAQQHLQRWENLRVAWGHEHPHEQLPEWILSNRRAPGATR